MLYDITLNREETFDSSGGYMLPRSSQPNVRLTVVVTPWAPLTVPPGSTLVINRDTGPEAQVTGNGIALVARDEVFYTQSRIIDGYELLQRQGGASEFLAFVGEELITDAIRAVARRKVEQLQDQEDTE